MTRCRIRNVSNHSTLHTTARVNVNTIAKMNLGGYTACANLVVTPGETLVVMVGCPGVLALGNGANAYGGGGAVRGASYHSLGGGGGRSAIQRAGMDILTAGGRSQLATISFIN